MTNILFISDVISWNDYKKIFDEARPEIVMMGGDLVSDGIAEFWSRTQKMMIEIPKFREEFTCFLEEHRKKLEELNSPYTLDLIISNINRGYIGKIRHERISASNPISFIDKVCHRDKELYKLFHKQLRILEEKVLNSKNFYDYVYNNHVAKFYEAINYSKQRGATVFTVMGDHDYYDFPRLYSKDRIRKSGGYEISREYLTCKGLRILGLGFLESHYLRKLKPLVQKYHEKVDVVLTHAEQKRMPLIARLSPKIILRGHFLSGIYKVNGVVTASTRFPSHVLVTFEDNGTFKVKFRTLCPQEKVWHECNLGCKHNLQKISEKWSWLKYDAWCPLKSKSRILHN